MRISETETAQNLGNCIGDQPPGVLTGAIAYRTSAAEAVETRRMRQYQERRQPAIVTCPKCGESYALVEGTDADDDTLQEDVAFLLKTISTVHPCHPAHVFVRDPDGVLHKVFESEAPKTLHLLSSAGPLQQG